MKRPKKNSASSRKSTTRNKSDICEFCLEGKKLYKRKNSSKWTCDTCEMHGNDKYTLPGIQNFEEEIDPHPSFPMAELCNGVPYPRKKKAAKNTKKKKDQVGFTQSLISLMHGKYGKIKPVPKFNPPATLEYEPEAQGVTPTHTSSHTFKMKDVDCPNGPQGVQGSVGVTGPTGPESPVWTSGAVIHTGPTGEPIGPIGTSLPKTENVTVLPSGDLLHHIKDELSSLELKMFNNKFRTRYNINKRIVPSALRGLIVNNNFGNNKGTFTISGTPKNDITWSALPYETSDGKIVSAELKLSSHSSEIYIWWDKVPFSHKLVISYGYKVNKNAEKLWEIHRTNGTALEFSTRSQTPMTILEKAKKTFNLKDSEIISLWLLGPTKP